jgi:uncharacterized protein YbcI
MGGSLGRQRAALAPARVRPTIDAVGDQEQSQKTGVAEQISRGIVRLHSQYYGRGPTKAKTHLDGNLVAVVLEETFTKAERTLVDRGEKDAVQQIGEEFTAIVEQATGRTVKAFLSETNLEEDVAVEIFLLADDRTDMSGFEDA